MFVLPLHRIHRRIRMAQERLGIAALPTGIGQADARAHLDLVNSDTYVTLKHLFDPSDNLGGFEFGGPFQHEHKLITTQTRSRVTVA
jgi:hypothetical protein